MDILLVEDNPADVVLLQEAMKGSFDVCHLHVATGGEQAIAFLTEEGATRPDLILLDLNMPGIDGRQVLATIKESDSLKRIPVVILTSSESDDDKLYCYEKHANAYMAKATDFNELVKVADAIREYWFNWVKLPPK